MTELLMVDMAALRLAVCKDKLSWTPTKQQLEDAARAGGQEVTDFTNWCPVCVRLDGDGEPGLYLWQPHLPTTQGKADLLDLMTALGMEVTWNFYPANRVTVVISMTASFSISFENDKHAALARAVIEVAAQVGGVIRNNTMREGV